MLDLSLTCATVEPHQQGAQMKIAVQGHAVVSRYTSFDPAKPEAMTASDFSVIALDRVDEDGVLHKLWAEDGYVLIGRAEITIDLLDRNTMTSNAVKSLQAQKLHVLAEAQAKATNIDAQIQNLLAITHEG